MRTGPDIRMTARASSPSLRALAGRALALAAAMMLIHSALMLEPVRAHGEPAESIGGHQRSMRMPEDSTNLSGSEVAETRHAGSPRNPAPQPDDRHCGVVLPGVMHDSHVLIPVDAGQSFVQIADTTKAVKAVAVMPAEQDRPTQDPRRKRSLLQIWRV